MIYTFSKQIDIEVNYELHTWLEEVQSHAVLVAHKISEKVNNVDVVLARAWATLIFLDTGPKEVPLAAQLKDQLDFRP